MQLAAGIYYYVYFCTRYKKISLKKSVIKLLRQCIISGRGNTLAQSRSSIRGVGHSGVVE